MPKRLNAKNRKEQKLRYYTKHRSHTNSLNKRNYTEQELLLIKQHLISDVELSKLINRSVQAIQVKRSRINK